MNILSGRGSSSDTNLSDTSTVSDADGVAAINAVPVSCPVLTPSLPALRMPVNGVPSPSVFCGFPVLTLPSLGRSPRRGLSPARTPRSGSPRASRSPVSPRRRQLLTASEGQPCIDQVFRPVSHDRAASVPPLSSLPVSEPTLLSEVHSHFMSPNRKRARLDAVSRSPLLSSSYKRLVNVPPQNDFQSSDVSADVGFSKSDNNCSDADMRTETCFPDAMTPVETDCVRRPISANTAPETVAVTSTPLSAGEVAMASLKVTSAVSSTRCCNNAASQECTSKTVVISSTLLKISMSKLKQMRQIWKQNNASVCEKSSKMCLSNSRNSDTSVSQSSSVTGTNVNSVVTKNIVSSVSICATSAATPAELSTTTSTTVVSSAISSKVNDSTSCEHSRVDRQSVLSHGAERDSFVTVSMKLDASSSKDNQSDLDKCEFEDSDELSYPPVESKPFLLPLLS